MSELTGAVGDERPSGGDWLRWARAMSQSGALGLPLWLATRFVERLVRELNRSVGHAYPSRYEALSLLRCGPYGPVVLDVARRRVAEPHVQVLFDLMSAVGEHADPEAVAWCLELLRDPRERVVVGAALALENMGETSADPRFWAPLVEPLLTAYEQDADREVSWRWLSHLLRLVPAAQLRQAGRTPSRPLAPAASSSAGGAAAVERHGAEAQAMARAVAAEVDLPEQPMLARLLYEITFGPFETRAVPAYMLLGAVPRLAAAAAEQIGVVVQGHEDAVVRDRAGRRLAGLVHGSTPAVVEGWPSDPDPALRSLSLRLAGAAGRSLPGEVLVEAVGDDRAPQALYAAGMTGHRVLSQLASSPGVPDGVRGAARWWTAEGTRITDE